MIMKISGTQFIYPAPPLLSKDDASLFFRLITEDGWERSYSLYGDYFTLAMVLMTLAEEKIEEAVKSIERYKAEGKLTDGKP